MIALDILTFDFWEDAFLILSPFLSLSGQALVNKTSKNTYVKRLYSVPRRRLSEKASWLLEN